MPQPGGRGLRRLDYVLEAAPVLPIHHYAARNLDRPEVRGVWPNASNLIALLRLAVG